MHGIVAEHVGERLAHVGAALQPMRFRRLAPAAFHLQIHDVRAVEFLENRAERVVRRLAVLLRRDLDEILRLVVRELPDVVDEQLRRVVLDVDVALQHDGLVDDALVDVLIEHAREDDGLERVREIFERAEAHRLAFLRRDALHLREEASDAHGLLVADAGFFAGLDIGDGDEVVNDVLVLVERMARDVKACRLLFPCEDLVLARLGDVRQLELRGLIEHLRAEQAELAAHRVALLALRLAHGLVEHGEQLAAPSLERVERAAADKALDGALRERPRIDARTEIDERRERAVLRALLRHDFQRVFADVAHGREAEADRGAVDREIRLARVDVGRQDGDAHAAALLDVTRNLVRVHDARQHRRHELLRVMRLEIRRLPRDKRVRRAVRLVEAIVGEMRQQIENRIGEPHLDAVLFAAVEEVLLLPHQDLRFFLAHRAAQEVGLPEREAREHLHDLHDLLLIQHDAERLLEDRFEERMHVCDFLLAVAAGDEVLDHARAQRPRAVERDRRDEVGEFLRREVFDELRHAARFHLEHGARLAVAEHLRGQFVFQRNLFDVDRLAAIFFDVLDAVRDDRERAQAEEVHLQQAELLDVILVVLRDERAVRHGHRHVVRQRMARDHDAGCVRRAVARQAFDLARHVDEAVHLVASLVRFAEIR